MNFQDAVKSGFKNYINFTGRAARSEFWYWVLFSVIGGILFASADAVVFPENDQSPLASIFHLALLLPSLAIGARRLHDIDRTGWWQLLELTIVGIFVLIYWWVQPSQPGANRFGGPAPTSA
ncbi:MAG: DUF805 domain-containing protein [Pseudorhodoplanes sp.]|nr:DUF805 domain-containing protein [Pseudorhodoplanes sp.]